MDHLFVARRLMIATGTWRLNLDISPRKRKLYKFYSFVMQCYLVCFVAALVIEFPIVLFQKKIDKAIENISVTILCFIIAIKVYICQKQKVRDILQYVPEAEKIVSNFGEEAVNVHNSYASYTRRLSVFLFIYSLMCGVTLVPAKVVTGMWWQENFEKLLANNETITDFDRPLPYVIWRPISDKKHYAAAFVMDVISASVGVTFNSTSQLSILSILTFVTSQLKVIQIRFRNFGNEENGCEKRLYDEMRELILHHKQTILFVENLDKSMRMLLLLEFTINSIQITALMLQFLESGIDVFFPFRTTYMSLMILQLFLLAWYSNEIKEQSVGISEAVYQSEWYKHSERIKKCLYVVTIRAGKPLSLSVGPFFKLSNDTAVTSMKAAYSYLTILRKRRR